jgi:hypothetical protein
MRKAVFAFLLAIPTSAVAQGMTVEQFVTRATAIEKKGVAALLMSSDARALGRELAAAAAATRDAQEAETRRGGKAATCLPPKGKARIDGRELLAYLRSIPPAGQRTTSLRAGFTGYARKKYPCPA